MAVITAQSTPDYDEFFKIDSYWSAQDWIDWHRALVRAFGKAEADRRFLKGFMGGGVLGSGFLATHADYRSFNKPFITYFKSQGQLWDAMNPGLFGSASKALATGYEVTDNAIETAGNVANRGLNFVDNTTNWLQYVLVAVVIICIALIIFIGYNVINRKAQLI